MAHIHYTYSNLDSKTDAWQWRTCRVCGEMFEVDHWSPTPSGRARLFGTISHGYKGSEQTREQYESERLKR